MQELFTTIGLILQTLSASAQEAPTHNVSANILVEPVAVHVEVEEKIAEKKEVCDVAALEDFYGNEKKIIENALAEIPCELVQGLQKVSTYNNPNRPRALTSATALYLRNDFFTLPEAEEVLIHELGHIVDLSGVRSKKYQTASAFKDGHATIFSDDPSVIFYSISWKNNTTWRKNTTTTDFVTGYAASDPFEDFSESFVMYIKHGNTFRTLAKDSSALQKKYDFLKEEIFEGEEFVGGKISTNIQTREWDSTKI